MSPVTYILEFFIFFLFIVGVWFIFKHCREESQAPRLPARASRQARARHSVAGPAQAARCEIRAVRVSAPPPPAGAAAESWSGGNTTGGGVCAVRAGSVEGQSEDPEACPICMEDFRGGDALWALSCCHRYHEACIRRWLARKQTCPVCQRPASADHAAWTL